jgi:hypothetical protein
VAAKAAEAALAAVASEAADAGAVSAEDAAVDAAAPVAAPTGAGAATGLLGALVQDLTESAHEKSRALKASDEKTLDEATPLEKKDCDTFFADLRAAAARGKGAYTTWAFRSGEMLQNWLYAVQDTIDGKITENKVVLEDLSSVKNNKIFVIYSASNKEYLWVEKATTTSKCDSRNCSRHAEGSEGCHAATITSFDERYFCKEQQTPDQIRGRLNLWGENAAAPSIQKRDEIKFITNTGSQSH